MENNYWYTLLYAAIAIFGILCILKGRKLYLANGESPTVKKVVGRLMMFLAVGLIALGAYFLAVMGYDPSIYGFSLTIGIEALIAGFFFLLAGRHKVKTGRAEAQAAARQAAELKREKQQAQAPTPQPAAPTHMVCPACGKTFPMDVVYCDTCGSKLKEE